MKIIKPGGIKVENGSAYNPAWLDEFKKKYGKWVQLTCNCIVDVNVPKCVELLTGKKVYIECPYGHGFGQIVKSLSFKDVLRSRGIEIPDNEDDQLPPF